MMLVRFKHFGSCGILLIPTGSQTILEHLTVTTVIIVVIDKLRHRGIAVVSKFARHVSRFYRRDPLFSAGGSYFRRASDIDEVPVFVLLVRVFFRSIGFLPRTVTSRIL